MRYSIDIRRWAFSLLLPVLVIVTTVEAGRELPTVQDKANMPVGELIPGTTIGQVFMADQAAVRRIDIALATYARQNTGDVVFHIRPSPAAPTDWVTLRLDVATVADNAYHAFEFAPLPNRRGDQLYFFLEAQQAAPGNAITVWANSQDLYVGGRAVALWPLDARAKDLQFRVYYQPSPPEAIGGILDQLAARRSGIVGNRGWYAVLAIVYLLLLFGLGWNLFAVRAGSGHTSVDR